MNALSSLKDTLKRGALVTAANWPVILIQFASESTFKLLLGIPILGGALLVSLVLGADGGELLNGSARETVAAVGAALADHPGALTSFVAALGIVVLGGSALMFLLKGGTVSVLVKASAAAGALERPPMRLAHIRRAAVFSPEVFTEGCTLLFRRYLRLGLLLLVVYGLSAVAYLAFIIWSYDAFESHDRLMGWTLVAALASSALAVWITLVNFAYLLTQIVLASSGGSVRRAFGLALRFVGERTAPVMLVFLALLGLVILATVASVVATAGLGLISFIPFVGLAVFPLQAAAWLVRGFVFQFLGLTALGAYTSIYQAHQAASAGNRPPAWMRTAS